jgi:hypothetical protein
VINCGKCGTLVRAKTGNIYFCGGGWRGSPLNKREKPILCGSQSSLGDFWSLTITTCTLSLLLLPWNMLGGSLAVRMKVVRLDSFWRNAARRNIASVATA